MNLTLRSLRGPAGRRAVIAAGVACLLVSSLSAAEGSAGPARQPASRRPAGRPGGPAAASATGLRLLGQAARAARQTSYRGLQVVSWQTPADGDGWLGSGASRVTVDVWHRSGVGTLTRVAAPSPGTRSGVDDDPAGQPPDGVLGLTPALVGLLGAHYAVLYTGTGSADGRPARIVEALRENGSVAARFWLDRATRLPLRRELFDPQARMISDDDFVGLTLGSASGHRAVGGSPRSSPAGTAARPGADLRIATSLPGAESIPGLGVAPPAAGRRPAVSASPAVAVPPAFTGRPSFRPWAEQLGPAQLAALRAGGWTVPGRLPGGLMLFDASQAATATGEVVDLAYSDGLSVVSVFVQRGQLPAALPGWRETGLRGSRLYVRNPGEPDLTWSAGGFVYTVVAGAPAPTVIAVVNALPHQAPLGFWGRMKCGIRRVLSWLDPFR